MPQSVNAHRASRRGGHRKGGGGKGKGGSNRPSRNQSRSGPKGGRNNPPTNPPVQGQDDDANGPNGSGDRPQSSTQPAADAAAPDELAFVDNRPQLQTYRAFLLDDVFDKYLNEWYPDVQILPGEHPSQHPLLALDRDYGYYAINAWLKRTRGTGHVCEIGPRLDKMSPGHHGCAPVITTPDASRWKRAVADLTVNMNADATAMEAWHKGGDGINLPRPNSITVCQHRAEECQCRFNIGTYISVHSLYYLSPEDVVEMLHRPNRDGSSCSTRRLLAYVHKFGTPNDMVGEIRTPSTGSIEARWHKTNEGSVTEVEFQVEGEAQCHRHNDLSWLSESDVYQGFAGGKIGWQVVLNTAISRLYCIEVVPDSVVATREAKHGHNYLAEIRNAISTPSHGNLSPLCDVASAKLISDQLALTTKDDKTILIPVSVFNEARIWAVGKQRTPVGFQQLLRKIKRHISELEPPLPSTIDISATIHILAALAYKIDVESETATNITMFGSDQTHIDIANDAVSWSATKHWINRYSYGLIPLTNEEVAKWRRRARMASRIAGLDKIAPDVGSGTAVLFCAGMTWLTWRFDLAPGGIKKGIGALVSNVLTGLRKIIVGQPRLTKVDRLEGDMRDIVRAVEKLSENQNSLLQVVRDGLMSSATVSANVAASAREVVHLGATKHLKSLSSLINSFSLDTVMDFSFDSIDFTTDYMSRVLYPLNRLCMELCRPYDGFLQTQMGYATRIPVLGTLVVAPVYEEIYKRVISCTLQMGCSLTGLSALTPGCKFFAGYAFGSYEYYAFMTTTSVAFAEHPLNWHYIPLRRCLVGLHALTPFLPVKDAMFHHMWYNCCAQWYHGITALHGPSSEGRIHMMEDILETEREGFHVHGQFITRSMVADSRALLEKSGIIGPKGSWQPTPEFVDSAMPMLEDAIEDGIEAVGNSIQQLRKHVAKMAASDPEIVPVAPGTLDFSSEKFTASDGTMDKASILKDMSQLELAAKLSKPSCHDDLLNHLSWLYTRTDEQLAEYGIYAFAPTPVKYHCGSKIVIRSGVQSPPAWAERVTSTNTVGSGASSWFKGVCSYVATSKSHVSFDGKECTVTRYQQVGEQPLAFNSREPHIELWEPRTYHRPSNKRALIRDPEARADFAALDSLPESIECNTDTPIEESTNRRKRRGLSPGNIFCFNNIGALVVGPFAEEIAKRAFAAVVGSVVPGWHTGSHLLAGVGFGLAEMLVRPKNTGLLLWPAVVMHSVCSCLEFKQGVGLHAAFNAYALQSISMTESARELNATPRDDIVDVCCRDQRGFEAPMLDPKLKLRNREFSSVSLPDLTHVCVPRVVGKLVGFGLTNYHPVLYRSCSCNEAHAAYSRLCRPVNWDSESGLLGVQNSWSMVAWLLSTIGEKHYVGRMAESEYCPLTSAGRMTLQWEAVPRSPLASILQSVDRSKYILYSCPFESWLQRYTLVARQDLVEARRAVKEVGLQWQDANVDAFIKREWKPLHVDRASGDYKTVGDPRVIQGRSDKFKVAMGPWMWTYGKQLRSAWHWKNGSVINCASGQTAEAVGAWFHAAITQIVQPVCIVQDVPRWDSQVSPPAKAKLLDTYIRLGAPQNVIKIRSLESLQGRFRQGTRYTTVGQVQSGDGDTSVGNDDIHGSGDLALACLTALEYVEKNISDHGVDELTGLTSVEYNKATRDELKKSARRALVDNMLTNVVSQHVNTSNLRVTVLGDDGSKVFSREYFDRIGGLKGYKAWWESLGFSDTDFAIVTPDEMEFCSSRFWPVVTDGQPSRVLGPKIGRMLSKTFYVKSEIPDKLHEAWLKSVCVGVEKDVSFIPILRVVVKTLLRLTSAAPDLPMSYFARYGVKDFEEKVRANSPHEVCDDTWCLMETLYGCTKSEVLEVERLIAGLPDIGLSLEHPLLDAIAAIDNGSVDCG